jgi:hypothetical protein
VKKNQVLAMFDPNLRGGSPKKIFLANIFGEDIENIWKNWKNMAPW